MKLSQEIHGPLHWGFRLLLPMHSSGGVAEAASIDGAWSSGHFVPAEYDASSGLAGNDILSAVEGAFEDFVAST